MNRSNHIFIRIMKIIHTSDLHLGQVLYQHYEREDEHEHFFRQLAAWCRAEKPDALVVSGDVFDVRQPGAHAKRFFNEHVVALAQAHRDMTIVVTAGNHDSASYVQADSPIWAAAGVRVVGLAPSPSPSEDGWQDDYIVRLPQGYVIALPYMPGERPAVVEALLERVSAENTEGKPVVLMAHAAISGTDMEGHPEIGKMRTQGIETLGRGWDYLALGHIHKPQTLGHPDDQFTMDAVTYPSGVARYCGSALHVSCDETYPHTVSVVDVPAHGASVTIRQLRIDELRHFYVLPEGDGSYGSEKEALEGVKAFCEGAGRGYFRLRLDAGAELSPDFLKKVYDLLEGHEDKARFNPKPIWTGKTEKEERKEALVFEVADLQQMTDPMVFIEKTIDRYPGLPDVATLRTLFDEVRAEMDLLAEARAKKGGKKSVETTVQGE